MGNMANDVTQGYINENLRHISLAYAEVHLFISLSLSIENKKHIYGSILF